jgi:hypothetical protein
VLSVVFFILLIFFGSFFVFNLVLVVVAENYLKVRARVRTPPLRLHTPLQPRRCKRRLLSFFFPFSLFFFWTCLLSLLIRPDMSEGA